MNLVPGTHYFTANGTAPSTQPNPVLPVRVFSIELGSGASASTLILYSGSSASGREEARVVGIANQNVVINYAAGKRFTNGLFVVVDANITYATVTYTEEF